MLNFKKENAWYGFKKLYTATNYRIPPTPKFPLAQSQLFVQSCINWDIAKWKHFLIILAAFTYNFQIKTFYFNLTLWNLNLDDVLIISKIRKSEKIMKYVLINMSDLGRLLREKTDLINYKFIAF